MKSGVGVEAATLPAVMPTCAIRESPTRLLHEKDPRSVIPNLAALDEEATGSRQAPIADARVPTAPTPRSFASRRHRQSRLLGIAEATAGDSVLGSWTRRQVEVRVCRPSRFLAASS